MGWKIRSGCARTSNLLKKILVTGGRGLIGKHCLPMLLARGFEVHVVSTAKQSTADEIHWHQADLLDVRQARAVVRKIKPSHILHLAWCTEHGKFWYSPENLNWMATSLALIHEFTDIGGERFVGAGTCAEYDWSNDMCAEGSTPCSPGTLYGISKYSTYLMLEAWARRTSSSIAWGRLFFLYGPGEQSSRFVPSIVQSIMQGKQALCSNGDKVRDFIYASDAAAGFIALLESEVEGSVNIASGKGVRLKDIAYTISDQLGRRDLISFGGGSGGQNNPDFLVADTRRLHEEVGFTSRYELEEGISLTIDFLRSQAQGPGLS